MKKILIAMVAILFTTTAIAQTEKQTKPAAKTPMMTHQTMKTHCYTMKDGAMMHCMGTKAEPMTKDVTLKNGTRLSTTGEITMKDGKKTTLTNGKAIDVKGKIGDFDKMHKGMKKM